MRTLLIVVLLLTGCATPELNDIVQSDLSKDDLYSVCEPYKRISYTLYGCKREAFNRCYIYVLRKEEHPSIEEYIDTVEHERRHCLEGAFHEGGSGVNLPRIPSIRGF
jgi:hypothetical protein